MLNLRGVDLNLLPVFEAAYEERSLSRAAQRLAMTQPAVSHAMTRLRHVFNDELFIRKSRGVTPTPVAKLLYEKLRGPLGSVREAIAETREFEPRTSTRRFFVTIPHPLGPMIAVRLRERLARLAPNVQVEFSTRSRPIDLARDLREGRVDAAIDWLVPSGGDLHKTVVFEDRLVAMARRGHPVLRLGASSRTLQSVEFVILRQRVEGEHPVPALRELRRLELRVALEVSEFIEGMMVAGQSDLLALVPRSMRRTARAMFGLRTFHGLTEMPAIAIKLIWHNRNDRDAGHAFLRKQLIVSANHLV